MKKINLILAAILSAAFLASLIAPAIAYPWKDYWGSDQSCVCDHWRENQVNSYFDEYTASGLTGNYSSGSTTNYQLIASVHQAGYGGFFSFYGDYSTACNYYEGAASDPTNPNWDSLYHSSYYNSSIPDYPVRPWPGGTWDYECRTTRLQCTSQPLNISKIQTQQWFYDQNFYTPWLCGQQWALVHTSN